MQQPEVTPLQEAIRQVRTHYERGEISFDTFEQALDALLQAKSADECHAIVARLPVSPAAALDPLAPPAAPATPPISHPQWLIALMGSVCRKNSPWRLGAWTIGVAVMGSIELDLSLAALPRQGRLSLCSLMGGVRLYVPRSLQVSVRGLTLMGDVNVLGKSSGGLISLIQEESDAADTPETLLEIEILTVMSGVAIIPVDGPVVTGDLDQIRRMQRQVGRW
jgi:hypothetical protein